ncbi:microcin C7 self-immunity protein MccF [Holospora obtusa F1]|uniref:Microcin C7 self-immunity protein MccF n=2 Tax=Holospora obtusa TaxID=49893 RepID=W6TDJ5_HOLOB|nr:microcin C7 self-immunity protein MccF [Holospora obtusa F1]
MSLIYYQRSKEMQPLIKPPKLNYGDTVTAITLSWGGPATFPYRFEVGKQRLEEIFGLRVLHTKHALKSAEWIYQNPKARADDLMEAFLDPHIKAIISNIGGDDSLRLIPFIDFNIIKNNPKVVMGYSDTTVTHFMCFKAGLTSFYGPSVMTAFAENVAMHDYTISGILKTLFSSEIIGAIPNNTEGWTTELLDWFDENNQSIRRSLNPPSGWHFIGENKHICKGRLIGGCLEVMQFLNNTELWPDLSTWDRAVLFLETSEEGIEPSVVTRFMRNLAAQGIISRLSGILFSKPGGSYMTVGHFHEYDQALLKVFEEYKIPPIPIVTRMDFGHSDPMWILPYGVMVEINPGENTVTILENSVR